MSKTPNPNTVAKALTPAVNVVLLATVLHDTLREEIDGYSREVLAAGTYPHEDTGEPVRDPKDAWLIVDDVWPVYYAKVEAKFRAAGHDVPPGFCPALMAESDLHKAQALLIESSKPFFGVTADQLLGCFKNGKTGLDTHREFLDLLIGLVVNHPTYRAPVI